MTILKRVALLLALPLGLSAVVGPASADEPEPFADIDPSSAFYDDIVWLWQEGITEGAIIDGQLVFAPTDALTRNAAAVWLYRYATDNIDVSVDDAVQWMKDEGITTLADYRGEDPCTREAFVTFLWRFQDQPWRSTWTEPFVDITRSSAFYKPITWAAKKGVTNGVVIDGQRYFVPTDPITREAAAAMLHRTDLL